MRQRTDSQRPLPMAGGAEQGTEVLSPRQLEQLFQVANLSIRPDRAEELAAGIGATIVGLRGLPDSDYDNRVPAVIFRPSTEQ